MSKSSLLQQSYLVRPVGGRKVRLSLPPLFLPCSVWQKLLCYVGAVETEISGFGTISTSEAGLQVVDVFTLPQVVTTASASISAENVARMVDRYAAQGGDPRALCLQWHSHGTGSVYWSGVDEENISNLLCLADFMVSLEMNQRGECIARLDLKRPVPLSVELEPLVQLPLLEAKIREAYLAEVGKNVQRGGLDEPATLVRKLRAWRAGPSADPEALWQEPMFGKEESDG